MFFDILKVGRSPASRRLQSVLTVTIFTRMLADSAPRCGRLRHARAA